MAILLSGCVTPGGDFLASNKADPNDVCGQYHADLFNAEGYFGRQIAEGALTGAAAGALLGLALGAAQGKNMAQSVAIGAAAGAVAGGVGGYFSAREQSSKDKGELASTVYGDLEKESNEVVRATAAFQKLSECRRAAAERVKADVKAGRLTREQGQGQLSNLKGLFNAELAEADRIGAKMKERQQEFALASEKLLQSDPQAQQIWLAQRQQSMVIEPQPEPATKAPVKDTRKKPAKEQPKSMQGMSGMSATSTAASSTRSTGSKIADVAVVNDNLNKRTGDYMKSVNEGKQFAQNGGFELS